jgi:hypothetical protein
MTEPISEAATIKAIEKLLAYYNFQDEVQTREQLLDRWLRSYPIDWVRLAFIEALFQGRYKSASVESLLQRWKQRGQPLYHFGPEFERLVSHNCPKTFLSLLQISASPQAQSGSEQFLSSFMDEMLSIPSKKPFPEAQPISPSSQNLPLEDSSLKQEEAQEESIVAAHSLSSTDLDQPEASTDGLQEKPTVPFAKVEGRKDWFTHAVSRSEICRTANRVSLADPIHCFTPVSRPSGLYTKLAAMAIISRDD